VSVDRFTLALARILRPVVPSRARPQLFRAYAAVLFPTTTCAGRLARAVGNAIRRHRILASYGAYRRSPVASMRYLAAGIELGNFTYDIANEAELAQVVAAALNTELTTVARYLEELRQDERLRSELGAKIRGHGRGRAVHFGRRAGWYAAVRVVRPRTVVETGIHDGLGSSVLLRALERNASEGAEGRLMSFDILPTVGWLVPEHLRSQWDVFSGDSRELLPRTLERVEVDLFVHDSDHSYDHERFELEIVDSRASDGAVMITDNAHGGPAFAEFCAKRGIEPHVFIERPRRHFYPGAGMGITRVEKPKQQ
jgi:Methyltransferase domain